ncbi:hypothetical protein CHUAL_014065 [Chamberlinius hualienensis]
MLTSVKVGIYNISLKTTRNNHRLNVEDIYLTLRSKFGIVTLINRFRQDFSFYQKARKILIKTFFYDNSINSNPPMPSADSLLFPSLLSYNIFKRNHSLPAS